MKVKDLISKRKLKAILAMLIVVLLSVFLIYARKTQVMPQSAIYLLNSVADIKSTDRVLIFSPHPDDETIGAGGLIYQASKNGAKVKIVLVTDGNKHGLEDRRYEEFKKATGILGVPEKNLVFLNHPDGKLSKVPKEILSQEFLDQINSFNPSMIVYDNPDDQHPDHAAVGSTASDLIKNNRIKVASYQYLIHYSRFPQPKKLRPDLFVLPPAGLVKFDQEWQKLLLSNEAEDTKHEAILQYKSQLKVPILRSLILSFVRKNELFLSINQSDQ